MRHSPLCGSRTSPTGARSAGDVGGTRTTFRAARSLHDRGEAIGSAFLLPAASSVHGREHHWGTHPGSDRHRSPSRRRVGHVGFGATRFSEIVDIAGHPLVRDQLQVCWRRRGAPGNCGPGHKFAVTMVVLDVAGELETSAVFPGPGDLPERIDAIRESDFPDPCAGRGNRRPAPR